ncbi:MAG: hypothetical protein RIR12_1383 [Bacteroidota bacterium]|jgi:hypothetical protein
MKSQVVSQNLGMGAFAKSEIPCSTALRHGKFWLTVRLGDVAVFENRQPVAAAKFINKSSLFILLLGVIRRLKLKQNSEQKVENMFVAPPYSQTACCMPYLLLNNLLLIQAV